MRTIEITCSDQRLDEDGQAFDHPINPLPVTCPECRFPDLDHVPQPYAVLKSRTKTSNEVSLAAYGNLLVTERVKSVVEIVVPETCDFYPTVFRKTVEVTNWHLVVPRTFGSSGSVSATIPRCPSCGEPRSGHPGSQYGTRQIVSDSDIAKARNWASCDSGWDTWLDRDFILSVRFLHLLKKLGAKGLFEATCGELTKPDADDLKWIDNMLTRLSEHGIQLNAPGTLSKEDSRWFRAFLKGQKQTASDFDFKAFEKKHRIRLPRSYKDFSSQLGERSFDNVDDESGNTVRVLRPDQLDLKNCRLGAFEATDEDSERADGIMFARTNYGDGYCFDLTATEKEPTVLLYRHEGFYYEPYTDNFASFLRRIAIAGCSS